jgi:hypothetical protein
MFNQAFSKIGIIIILVVLVAGGFFAWQYLGPGKEATPDKTANWQTYHNEKFQYEIKYPPELEMLKEGIVPEMAPMISWNFPTSTDQNIAKFVSITVVQNTNQKNLRSLLGYDPTECKIDKEQATFLEIDCSMENGAIRLLMSGFLKNDWVYEISLEIMSLESLTGTDFTSEINTYNLMLSTFKFLEGEVTIPQTKTAKDVRVMSYMSQIGSAAQIYYDKNSSYLNLSTDGDMNNLQRKIQDETGKWPGMITSGDAYCMDVVLPDSKIRYCVDAEGRRGENLGCSSTQVRCINY